MKNEILIPAGGPVNYDYAIGRDPVTNEMYATWLKSLPAADAARYYCRLMATHFFGGILEDFTCKQGFAQKPVVFVSWYDALAYGASVGGRLPTTQEWRKAAAWLPHEQRYATWCTGCDAPPTQTAANFYDFTNGWALPQPHLADVDWYHPSGAYGCRGMAGNVGEWCVDEEKEWQPALGGSVFRPVEFCRTHSGEADRPDKRLSTFGFRLVRTVQK